MNPVPPSTSSAAMHDRTVGTELTTLDDHRRIGEAAERLGAVEMAGDEKERQAGQEAQDEAEEVGAAAPCQRRHVGLAVACRLGGRRCGTAVGRPIARRWLAHPVHAERPAAFSRSCPDRG